MFIKSSILYLLTIAALAAPSTARSQEVPDWFIYLVATTPKVLTLNTLKISSDEPELKQLLEKRHNAVLEELVARHWEFWAGRGTVEFMYDAAIRLRKSRLELARNKAERLAIMQDHIDWTKVIEKVGKDRNERAVWPTKMYKETTYRRIQAEIDLMREVETK